MISTTISGGYRDIVVEDASVLLADIFKRYEWEWRGIFDPAYIPDRYTIEQKLHKLLDYLDRNEDITMNSSGRLSVVKAGELLDINLQIATIH